MGGFCSGGIAKNGNAHESAFKMQFFADDVAVGMLVKCAEGRGGISDDFVRMLNRTHTPTLMLINFHFMLNSMQAFFVQRNLARAVHNQPAACRIFGLLQAYIAHGQKHPGAL